jgi:hypothetical protein
LINFLLPKDTVEAQVNYAKGAMGYVLPMNALACPRFPGHRVWVS